MLHLHIFRMVSLAFYLWSLNANLFLMYLDDFTEERPSGTKRRRSPKAEGEKGEVAVVINPLRMQPC